MWFDFSQCSNTSNDEKKNKITPPNFHSQLVHCPMPDLSHKQLFKLNLLFLDCGLPCTLVILSSVPTLVKGFHPSCGMATHHCHMLPADHAKSFALWRVTSVLIRTHLTSLLYHADFHSLLMCSLMPYRCDTDIIPPKHNFKTAWWTSVHSEWSEHARVIMTLQASHTTVCLSAVQL